MSEKAETDTKEALRQLRDVKNVLGIDETISPAAAVLAERRDADAALLASRQETATARQETERCEVTMRGLMGTVSGIRGELSAALQREAALKAELERYGDHTFACHDGQEPGCDTCVIKNVHCTCGFSAALSPREQEVKG